MAFSIALVSFVLFSVIIKMWYNNRTECQYAISRRMEQYVKPPISDKPTVVQGQALVHRASHGNGHYILIRTISKHFESLQWSQRIEHKLIQAALPMRGAEFIVLCLASVGIGTLLLMLLSGSMLLGILGAIVGLSIPLFILRRKIEQRKKAFNDQLGDTIILIANALRTGYSFMQAIEMVSREMTKPISEEFARVLKEMNLGVTTEDSLNNMAKRVNSEDLDLVITAVLIQRQVGGNLAVVLDSIALTIRERIKIKGQIQTLTAQGKISGLIIGLLPFGIGCVIYILNPTYIKILFINPIGQMMLVGGLFSQLIGMMMIRKIINIDI